MDVKGILILVLAIVFGLFIWRVQSKLEKAERLDGENKALIARVSTLEERAEEYDQALLDKAARDKYARDVRRNIATQLEESRNDPESAAYLDTRIPDGVRRGYLAGEGRTPPAGAADADADGTQVRNDGGVDGR